MSKLKHAGKAQQGEFIRSRDFAFLKDTYIEGRVMDYDARDPEQGVPCYLIIVTRDVRAGVAHTGSSSRVGHAGWVPHQLSIMESDDRVERVTFEAGDVTEADVRKLYEESGLPITQGTDAQALAANANGSARISREWNKSATARNEIANWIATQLLDLYLEQQAAAKKAAGDSDQQGSDA
jgi:hypothetical protein